MKRLAILDAIRDRDWANLAVTPVSGVVVKLMISELNAIADASTIEPGLEAIGLIEKVKDLDNQLQAQAERIVELETLLDDAQCGDL